VFVSRFMPCGRCGESLDLAEAVPHECAPARVVDFQMFALRDDVAAFETRFEAWLQSPSGRFEAWLAGRHVRRSR